VEAALGYEAMGDGLVFATEPMPAPTELTGPASARLTISSTTSDADLFLVLGVVDPDGEEVVFQGALDPHAPVAQGWLRASHRALDPERSHPWRPWHPHDRVEPIVPGERYTLDIEIWPTSIVIPDRISADPDCPGQGLRILRFRHHRRRHLDLQEPLHRMWPLRA
jgi:predicted acyl esterase